MFATFSYIFSNRERIQGDRAVIKFSSEDCGICHKMSFYDQKVSQELGLQFIDVKMQDTATYRKYRKFF